MFFYQLRGVVYILVIIPILPKGYICCVHALTRFFRFKTTKILKNHFDNRFGRCPIFKVSTDFLILKIHSNHTKNHPQSKKIKPFIELNPNHPFSIKLNTIKPPKILSSKLLKPLINQPFQQN